MDEIEVEGKSEEVKLKKWDHIPVRPETFQENMALKDKNLFKSNDAFQKELYRLYRIHLMKNTGEQA